MSRRTSSWNRATYDYLRSWFSRHNNHSLG
jgi:hypothetical protein